MKTVIRVPPAQEPIGLSRIKNHARQMSDVHDDLLLDLIAASRSMSEQLLGIAIIQQELTQYRNRFERVMRLPRPPLVSVESIEYQDPDDVLQVVDAASYTVDSISKPGKIILNAGYSWPITSNMPNSIQIKFTAGYGPERTDVPESLKQGLITLAINQYYQPGMMEAEQVRQIYHAYMAEHYNWLLDEV